jgi:hypothetical protein
VINIYVINRANIVFNDVNKCIIDITKVIQCNSINYKLGYVICEERLKYYKSVNNCILEILNN